MLRLVSRFFIPQWVGVDEVLGNGPLVKTPRARDFARVKGLVGVAFGGEVKPDDFDRVVCFLVGVAFGEEGRVPGDVLEDAGVEGFVVFGEAEGFVVAVEVVADGEFVTGELGGVDGGRGVVVGGRGDEVGVDGLTGRKSVRVFWAGKS